MCWTLGLDTSNYTTSAALFDGAGGHNIGKLLDVPEGALGLRQSDALFQHVKRLSSILEELMGESVPVPIQAVGASTRPREAEGSYMPCFLAGESQGRSLAQVMHLPFYACSHQQGHVAAAAWSAGRIDLLDQPHLAWHLSGGTTELLYVEPDGVLVKAKRIGGSQDLSAGQLIDRSGKRLGLSFPAGKAVDVLSREAKKMLFFSVKIHDCEFSLSGIENKVNSLIEKGELPAEICRFVLGSIIFAVEKATKSALVQYPGLPVLYAGGVASNELLRQTMCREQDALFAKAEFSTDNAMGVAILAHRMLLKER